MLVVKRLSLILTTLWLTAGTAFAAGGAVSPSSSWPTPEN